MLTKNVRTEIRREGMRNLKRRYFLNILITFVVSIVINGGYQFATRTQSDINDNAFGTTAAILGQESQKVDKDQLTTQVDEQVNALSEGNKDALKSLTNIDTVSLLAGKDQAKSNSEIVKSFIMNIFSIKEVPDPGSISTTSANYYGGVASVFVNEITGSQSFIFGILNGVNQLVFNGRIAGSILIFVFSIISIFVFIYVKNVFIVGNNRYFLEQRRYKDTSPSEILFPYKNKRLKNVALVMFMRYIFQLLWNMTIVGGIIKHYEYMLIPYIIAENPETSVKDAFRISKKLMHGEKWKVFVIDFSLIPWRILSYFTFNISGMLFSDAYFECVKAEIYMRLRTGKKNDLPLGLRKWLNDDLLAINHIEEGEHPSGVEVLDLPQVHIRHASLDYMREYSMLSLIELFFTYSLVGWLWEVVYYIATTGMVVNRGTMHGPWLPIYGCGGLLIILLLRPFRENPKLLFGGAVVVCGTVEYTTAWALETFLHKKWWDYTGYFLNLHGRICFEGLLVFGMAGLAFTYLFSPMLDDQYKKMSDDKRKILCAVLIVLFVADLVWSVISPNTGEGITM